VAQYDAYRATRSFISPDGFTVSYDTTLRAGGPDSDAAMSEIPAVRATVAHIGSELGAVADGVAGDASGNYDEANVSTQDLEGLVPLVLAVMLVILVLRLRSLVAPLYMIASVALSYLAALGMTILVFTVIGGSGGVEFVLPFLLFVFLLALGEDYNILVMTRIREEARRAPLDRAGATAMARTGTTVTSAGLILAGTFVVLTVTTTGETRQIGAGLAAGILLDTFLVRTLLLPALVVMLGRWNWWPSAAPGEEKR
jgi:RND superfamily putative drug exporter